MAKKTKDTATSTKKEAKPAKPAAPVDPVKTRNLIRLLNILALLIAIAAFLLQLFAVLTHHWKWQKTDLHALISPTYHYSQGNVYDDSRLEQHYGLCSREVKLYGNNDEQLDLWTSTRFPRPDEGDEHLHRCLSRTTSLRGAYLTCSKRIVAPNECHCRRYAYWNFVIAFEILALILLGVAVIVTALLTTHFQELLKLAGAGVSLLAFLLLLIGLILVLSHLKRETRTIADAFPHIHQRYADKLGVVHDPHRAGHRQQTALHRALRRQTHEHYRAYPLTAGQHPYNDTHFQEYSEETHGWVYKPYTSIVITDLHVPQGQRDGSGGTTTQAPSDVTPIHSAYGPVIGYNNVFDHTTAGPGWSLTLSIIAMILALLLPLILIFSWLQGKKLAPTTKTTTTTTTTKTEYVPLTQDVTIEKSPARPIPADYDPNRPIADAVVTTQNVTPRSEPFIVRDVIIRDEQPTVRTTTEEHTFPVTVESTQQA